MFLCVSSPSNKTAENAIPAHKGLHINLGREARIEFSSIRHFHNVFECCNVTYFIVMRRNRYDIFSEILDACRKEQCISILIQKCRLSSAQATEYLTHLTDCGFLKKNGTSFKSTGEGLILLEKFKGLFTKLNSASGA